MSALQLRRRMYRMAAAARGIAPMRRNRIHAAALPTEPDRESLRSAVPSCAQGNVMYFILPPSELLFYDNFELMIT